MPRLISPYLKVVGLRRYLIIYLLLIFSTWDQRPDLERLYLTPGAGGFSLTSDLVQTPNLDAACFQQGLSRFPVGA